MACITFMILKTYSLVEKNELPWSISLKEWLYQIKLKVE